MLATLKAGTSFKLTRVNPYFEDQGDYTFDVQLPLAGCKANQDIFGPIHRAEMSLVPQVGQKYDMQLIAPPINISGYAQITNVTEAEVKVQLVAGRSSFNRAIEDNEVYVDDMDLGNAWDEFEIFAAGEGGYEPGFSIEEQTNIFALYPNFHNEEVDVRDMMHGVYGKTDCVCFQTYSINDDKLVNPHVVDMPILEEERRYFYGLKRDTLGGIANTLLAPQPYLLDIVKRIIKATGYRVGNVDDVEKTWVAGIFIANTRSVIRRSAALPHWTFPEFIKQLQNFLGVVFTVNGQKEVDIRSRNSWYGNSGEAQHLAHVTDELSTDIDKDGENKGSSAGNVDYDWPNSDDMLRLPDEVWENSIIKPHASLAAIRNAFNALKPAERKKSLYLYKDRQTGFVYAILHRGEKDKIEYVLHRVDHYGPLIRNKDKRDIDTTLKIVPARMEVQGYYVSESGSMFPDESIKPSTLYKGTIKDGNPILSVADTALSTMNYYSVDNAINPIEDDGNSSASQYTDERKDILEVAYFNGETYCGGDTTMPIPMAVPYVKDPATGLPERPEKLSDLSGALPTDGVFSLLGEHPTSIASRLSNGSSIDTRAEHLFQFTDSIPGDPMSMYVIRGRRYACAKLEFTIDEHGVQPMKRGYFYEIN